MMLPSPITIDADHQPTIAVVFDVRDILYLSNESGDIATELSNNSGVYVTTPLPTCCHTSETMNQLIGVSKSKLIHRFGVIRQNGI